MSENEVEEHIRKTISDRVKERLNERLSGMSIENRAAARGLLRLQQQGRLDEYLEGLFSGNTNEELESELESQNAEYSVYYLIDRDVLNGIGHAAMLMGSESEGWHYFSFGKGTTGENGETTWQDWVTPNGNMEVDFFTTLNEAKEQNQRYEDFLMWNVAGKHSVRSAFAQATAHLKSNYNVFGGNCDDIAINIIKSAGIELDDNWFPRNTYSNNKNDIDEFGTWNSSPLN